MKLFSCLSSAQSWEAEKNQQHWHQLSKTAAGLPVPNLGTLKALTSMHGKAVVTFL